MTKTYGAPNRRPEVRFGTVEYAATADYMVREHRGSVSNCIPKTLQARPPQPAMYLFLLDVSHNAIQTGE